MRLKERIVINSSLGVVTIEPSSAPSWYYRPLQIIEENVNGEKIVIDLGSKVHISFADLLEPEAKNALDYALQGTNISATIQYYDGTTWTADVSATNCVILSKNVSREALLYNYSVELEQQ